MKFSSTAGISRSLSAPSSARPALGASVAATGAANARAVNAAPEDEKNAPAKSTVKSDKEAALARNSKPERDDEGAPKKRVRLKPETPEQLIERLRNPQLSLHEASILLRVSRATVRRYADSGRLGCQRTPGGQRRFFLRDIENFYRQLKLKR